jgi:WD40 repeat protein
LPTEADEVPGGQGTPSRYSLLEICGRGGFGAVWRGVDSKLGREIAVKCLGDRLARDPEARRRFVEEARLTSRLEHPGIIPVYDLLETSGDEAPRYVMKLVRGETLSAAIERFHQRPPASDQRMQLLGLLNVFVAVARTMEFAHSRGVLHRDLKPQNILVGEFGETIILDWGLAKDRNDSRPDDPVSPAVPGESPSVTQPGTVQGTPAYMAPEQASGRVKDVDERTDVYGLGVILYELLTGRLPFSGDTAEDVRQRVLDEHVVRPRSLNRHITPQLEAICMKAMAKSAADRYQTVRELREDIECVLADEPVKACRESHRERLARWTRRHRTLTGAVAASLAASCLVLLVALAIISNSRGREAAARQDADRQRDEARRQAGLAAERLDHVVHETYNMELLRVRDLWSSEPAKALAALDDPQRCPDSLRDFAWGYYHRLARRQRWLQKVGSGFLSAVALAPDGKTIATGGEDQVVRLLDATTGKVQRELAGHDGWVTDLAFSPDGKMLVSASADRTVRIWSIPEGRPIRTIAAHESHVNAIAISRDAALFVSGGSDGKIRRWSLANGELLKESQVQDGEVADLCFVGDSVASACEDGLVRLWDRELSNPKTLAGHEAPVDAVLALNEDREVASADQNGVVIVWNVADGSRRLRLSGHADRIQSLACAAARHLLVSASWDKTVRVWDLDAGQMKVTFDGQGSSALATACSPDGECLVSGDRDGRLTAWIVVPDACVATLRDEPKPLALTFVPDNRAEPDKRQLIVAGGDPLFEKPSGYLHVWGLGKAEKAGSLGGMSDTVTSVSASPSRRWVASGGSDRWVRIWDLDSGRELRRMGPHAGYVWSVVFSPDGRRLVSAGGDKRICLWDAETGELLQKLEGHGATVSHLAFDASGQRLASSDWDRTVIVWSVAEGREVWRTSGKSKGSSLLAFSGQGNLIATLSDSAYAVWRLPGEQPVFEFSGRGSRISAMCISPDFRSLASADDKGAICIWDPDRGQQRAVFQAGDRPILALAFSPDSRQLASAGSDGTVRIWLSENTSLQQTVRKGSAVSSESFKQRP